MWHGQFLLVPCVPTGPAAATDVIVARHGDAEVIGAAVEAFGMRLIRGAGAGERKRDRGGAAALRAALSSLKRNRNVALTADVPPGPARKASAGLITLARMSGRPIRPFAIASSRFVAFDTWSRMTLNLPFSRIGAVLGAPIHVPRDIDEDQAEQYRRELERALDAVTQEAYALAGGNIERATPYDARPLSSPPLPAGLRLRTYRTISRVLSPLARALVLARKRKGKEDSLRHRERLGETERSRPPGPLVWLHAASVGELNAILPLMDRLRAKAPGYRWLVTTGTVTSARLAGDRLPKDVIHQYIPVDVAPAMERFLEHWSPTLIVLTESELWPNLLLAASDRKIPVALVNARMSSRSFVRWRRNRRMARQLLSRLTLVLAQNERLARRFRWLGARDARVVGNLKVDAPALPVPAQLADEVRAIVGARHVMLAASTHAGEDTVIFDASAILLKAFPDLLTIVVPRHPERGGDVTALARERFAAVAQRSNSDAVTVETSVYVADTIGELGGFFSACPIAFIGGSLIRHGGQNPIEAIRLGACVVTGPHLANFEDIYGALRAAAGVHVVDDAATLAAAVAHLLTDEIERRRRHAAALEAVNALSGALVRTEAALLELLPLPDGIRRAG